MLSKSELLEEYRDTLHRVLCHYDELQEEAKYLRFWQRVEVNRKLDMLIDIMEDLKIAIVSLS